MCLNGKLRNSRICLCAICVYMNYAEVTFPSHLHTNYTCSRYTRFYYKFALSLCTHACTYMCACPERDSLKFPTVRTIKLPIIFLLIPFKFLHHPSPLRYSPAYIFLYKNLLSLSRFIIFLCDGGGDVDPPPHYLLLLIRLMLVNGDGRLAMCT